MDEFRNRGCPSFVGRGKIDRCNPEGYPDATVYEALKNIRKEENKQNFKPLVYICSAFSGDVEGNSEKARSYCKFALSRNALPIAMHLLLPQFMNDDDPEERQRAIFMNRIVQGKCDELWVFSDNMYKMSRKNVQKIWYKNVQLFFWLHMVF